MVGTRSRRPSSHAIGEAGRHLVAAEALLRGHKVEIKKSGRRSWVQVDDLHVEVRTARDDWPLDGTLVAPEADLVIFVRRGVGVHEFFIATRAEAIDALEADMRAWLATQPDGERPNTPDSDQQTLRADMA